MIMATQQFRQATHVIFDMDGLLLDTESIYTVATNKWLEKYDKVCPFEVKQKMMGRFPLVGAQVLIDELDLPCSAEECVKETGHLLMELFPDANFMPGAEQLVLLMHQKKIPIAVCTGSSEVYFEAKTRKHRDFFSMFDFIVCTPDDPEIKRGKPNPDCFLTTASRFEQKPYPSEVIVFEDALNGMSAAVSAGMQVVLVPDQRVDRSLCSDATLVLDCLTQFKMSHFGL